MSSIAEEGSSNSNNKHYRRDRSGPIMLAIVIVFVATSGILMLFLAPEIFKQGEKLDLALYQKHEDDARDLQSLRILTHVDNRINDLENNQSKLMRDMENRSNISSAQRNLMLDKLDSNTVQNSAILSSLQNRTTEHNIQSAEMKNLTDTVSESLTGYGENSVLKFDKIIDNQGDILDAISNMTQTIIIQQQQEAQQQQQQNK